MKTHGKLRICCRKIVCSRQNSLKAMFFQNNKDAVPFVVSSDLVYAQGFRKQHTSDIQRLSGFQAQRPYAFGKTFLAKSLQERCVEQCSRSKLASYSESYTSEQFGESLSNNSTRMKLKNTPHGYLHELTVCAEDIKDIFTEWALTSRFITTASGKISTDSTDDLQSAECMKTGICTEDMSMSSITKSKETITKLEEKVSPSVWTFFFSTQ